MPLLVKQVGSHTHVEMTRSESNYLSDKKKQQLARNNTESDACALQTPKVHVADLILS